MNIGCPACGMYGIEETGLAPYRVEGEPHNALLAQLNRFAGRTLSFGPRCGSKKLVNAPFPLDSILSPQEATTAWLIATMRYTCAPIGTQSTEQSGPHGWITTGADNPWWFVETNLARVTLLIAQYGDSLGLPPATMGIMQRDERLVALANKAKFTKAATVIGGLALGIVSVILIARRIP